MTKVMILCPECNRELKDPYEAEEVKAVLGGFSFRMECTHCQSEYVIRIDEEE